MFFDVGDPLFGWVLELLTRVGWVLGVPNVTSKLRISCDPEILLPSRVG